MSWQEQNIAVYNEAASGLSNYFRATEPRIIDINLGLNLAGYQADVVTEARVVEIGCGDGRDAEEIVKRAPSYKGFDPSVGMLDIARTRLPGVSFVEADALSYDYPEDTDIVFALASLYHTEQKDMGTVFDRVAESLRQGGIFYVALKERDEYTEEVKTDRFGERMFCYYNPGILSKIAERLLKTEHVGRQKMGNTDWFTQAFTKV